jgi:hypothetical protein
MIDAIPALLLGLSPLWLVSVVICSSSFLHTRQTNLTNIIPQKSYKSLVNQALTTPCYAAELAAQTASPLSIGWFEQSFF